MLGKKIIIIGGSVAGCAAGVLLQRLGLDVLILERSSAKLEDNGAGITLPEVLLKKYISMDLFDSDIPCLPISSRYFARKHENEASIFWRQPMAVVALTWAHIYHNLRKRIKPEHYQANQEVLQIVRKGGAYQVQTSSRQSYTADLVIAADGGDSSIRRQLVPASSSQYAGYIAWRGVNEMHADNQLDFTAQASYFVFPNGHVLLYKIPTKDYNLTGKKVLNWVLYESQPAASLASLLIDNKGRQHARSLARGKLTAQHLCYLKQFAQGVLPKAIAEIIYKTPKPFIQIIADSDVINYTAESIIFIGDAALTLRPHSGSGTAKALSNALELAQLLQKNGTLSLEKTVLQWQMIQQKYASEELPKARNMGDALVTNPPIWHDMNQESSSAWWTEVMQGKKWYATDNVNESLFF